MPGRLSREELEGPDMRPADLVLADLHVEAGDDLLDEGVQQFREPRLVGVGDGLTDGRELFHDGARLGGQRDEQRLDGLLPVLQFPEPPKPLLLEGVGGDFHQ